MTASPVSVSASAAPLLRVSGVSKSFLGIPALQDIELTLHRGEVHALLGENGAGKSTLVKIITGVYRRDAGQMLIEGTAVEPRGVEDAQGFGIGTVYQEVNLLPNLSVAQNLCLGREPRRFGLVHTSAMRARAREVLSRYGLGALDVAAPLSSYSVAVQQIVAIARAVELSGKVLILDEPTASLDAAEVERLFSIVRQLRDRGLAVVFITHFLDQVFALADRVTVLRNGRLVGTRPIAGLKKLDIVQMMLGRELKEETAAPPALAPVLAGEAEIRFRGFGRRGSVKPFDLDIRRGEVVGVAGLLGSGRTETARLLFGVDRADSGEASVESRPIRLQSPRDAIRQGFGFCPEERKTDGIVGELSVRENLILALQARRGWWKPLSRAEQNELSDNYIRALDIRTSDREKPIKFLSGGNQQKVILARWLVTQPRFLILDEPTRGIDVGAHAEIIRLIRELCDGGMSLLVISSELEELVAYSRRILVCSERAHVAELVGAMVTPDRILGVIAAPATESVAA